MLLGFPQVNGKLHSFAAVTLRVNGVPFRAVKAIDYKNAVERQHPQGTGQLPMGRTGGQYKGEMSVEIWRESYPDFLAMLGDGYLNVEFDVEVQFEPEGQEMQDMFAPGVCLNEDSASMSNSADGLSVKLVLDVVNPIIVNGFSPIAQPPLLSISI